MQININNKREPTYGINEKISEEIEILRQNDINFDQDE